MNDALRSVLVGTSGLAVGASLGLVLTFYRAPVRLDDAAHKWTRPLVATCLILQSAHFVEEYTTRFYERFPSLLGLASWSARFFVVFNVAWLTIWIFAALRLRSGARVVVFPLWFLAIAMVANGIAHPLLAVAAGGYFPGLITAPVLGIAGVALWMRLLSLTRPGGQTPARSSQVTEAT